MFSYIGETQTEIISRQIADTSPMGEAQASFISSVVSEFEASEFRL